MTGAGSRGRTAEGARPRSGSRAGSVPRANFRDVPNPSSTPAAALDAILELTLGQLDLLRDAASRPDVDRAALTRTAFEMTLKGMRAAAAKAAADPTLPAEARARMEAFITAANDYEKGAVRVGQHLIAISAGWQCPQCKTDVARTAALSGVAAGKGFVKLELVCAECGARSVPTPQGRKVFEEKFGHLVAAGWNPEVHGFQWDRR